VSGNRICFASLFAHDYFEESALVGGGTAVVPLSDHIPDRRVREPLVIQGLKQTLANDQCRILYCEIPLPTDHRPPINDYGESKESIISMSAELGFNIEYREKRGTEIHIIARK
jgi:hypothetical protein